MKRLELKSKNSEGLFAKVDDEDYPLLSRHNWHALRVRDKVYAQRIISSDGMRTELLHHMIMGRPQRGYVVDHINDDGLDNRKRNLRFLPNAENIRRKYRDAPDTGLKLKPDLMTNPWQAQVSLGGKTRHVGYFPTKEAAREARDAAIESYLNEQ